MKPVNSVVIMCAMEIPIHSNLFHPILYSPFVNNAVKNVNVSETRYNIAKTNVKTKNLCIKNSSNSITIYFYYNIRKKVLKNKV